MKHGLLKHQAEAFSNGTIVAVLAREVNAQWAGNKNRET